ncbi:carboxypeptidase regulatory-like domain-containing protein [Candidatus Berkelbacteria bacterium]|nr:carboxypeptidase regulatory-like domain-containing protein [Candidatus Berkelbacteria bacterium]
MRRFGRLFLGCAILVLAIGFLGRYITPAEAYGTISTISVTPASSTASASTSWTVGFTVEHAIPASGGRITIDIPGLYSYSSNGSYSGSTNIFGSATIASTSSPNTLSVYSRYWSSITLSTSSAISAGTTLSIVLNNVTNPGVPGYYFAHVYTTNYGTEIDGSASWNGDYPSAFFQIGSAPNVTGTVSVGETGIPYASFYLSTSDYTKSYYGYTDKNGRYGIGNVTAGTYTLRVYPPSSYNTTSTATVYKTPDASTVTVTDGSTVTKNISFESPTKTLTVNLQRSNGTGISGAQVWVSSSGYSSYGYGSATTNSSGNATFTVPAGNWNIGAYSNSSSPDWNLCGNNAYQTVSFAADTTTESKTATFTATSLSSTVTGTFTKPDGTSPGQYAVGMNFQNADNCWFYASTDSAGAFSTKVAPGTYTITGWVSDSNYSFPSISKFTVADSETKSLGSMTLVEKTDRITGTVKDNNGNAVSGASVYGWKQATDTTSYDWANTTTASDGSYTLKVTPGSWSVSAWPAWNSGAQEYVTDGKPASVTVTSGVTATQNFTFQKSTNTLTGRILDPDGNVLSTLSGWVGASDGSQPWSNVGTSVTSGTFTMKLPSGTWDINLYVYSSDYSTGDKKQVTFGENESKSVDLQLLKNDATISGTIYDSDGNKVTNTWMSVYATKGLYASWQNATVDQAAGTYSLKVSAGTWKLGWWIDQSLGYAAGNGEDIELTLASGETKTFDISLKKADATIKGKATKADGSTMQWAWITADTRDPNEKVSADTKYYSNGASTNNSGDYEMKVPAGTYWVGGSMWYGSGVINPKRVKVEVKKDETKTIDLVFRTADASIKGTVTKDGTATSAYVTGWSEDGGFAETNSNNAGSYELSVSSGTKWHVRAIKKDGSEVYKSKELILDLTSEKSATADLTLAKQEYTLPETKTVTFDPTAQQAIELGDGTTLTIPANTIATSGTVTLTAEPTAELAEEADAKPVAYGYDLNVVNENGTEITNFNGNVTMETTYEETWLDEANVQNEDELILGYYDEAAGTWKELSTCTVNADEDSVTCQMDHFTEFALIAASDTTPPAAPTLVSLTDKGTGGAITVTWTNPSDADFATVNVYRSTASGTLGSKVGASTSKTATTYDDTGLTDGTEYFYTVRAVDASGNESTSSSQSSVKPSKSGTAATTTSSLPKTGRPAASGPATAAVLFGLLLGGAIVVRTRRVATPTRAF